MKNQLFTVKDIIRITGVTARTLHYYDSINLLKPARSSCNDYRTYSRKDLEKLQTILFFKEMNISLKKISDIMKLPRHEQVQILKSHHQTLLEKQHRLNTIINALEEYMSGKDVLDLNIFNNSSVLPMQEQYDREAKMVYGDTKYYKEYEQSLENLSAAEKEKSYHEFEDNMTAIFKNMAANIHTPPSSENVQQLIAEWKGCLEKHMTCDSEILKCIADTYRTDSRFKNYINQFSSEDLSEFMYQAIMHYINTHG